MLLKLFMTGCAGLVLLTACNAPKQPETKEVQLNFALNTSLVPLEPMATRSAVLCGLWKYSFPFYSSELMISENGFFAFHDQGCTGHSYTRGKWERDGNDIVCTSFEEYKQERKKDLVFVHPNLLPKKRYTVKNKKAKKLLGYEIDPTVFNVTVYDKNWSDTVNIYFNHVRFRQEGNNLFRLDSNGIKTDEKFIATAGKL